MIKLTQEEMALLREVIQCRSPQNMPTVSKIDQEPLKVDAMEELQQALLDEMTEKGLDKDSEANTYGKQLDDIIGKLVYYSESDLSQDRNG